MGGVALVQVPLTGLPPRLRVAIDLDYDETESMHKSLGRQLSYVYGMMRREADAAGGAACVPSLHLTSATPQVGGTTTTGCCGGATDAHPVGVATAAAAPVTAAGMAR